MGQAAITRAWTALAEKQLKTKAIFPPGSKEGDRLAVAKRMNTRQAFRLVAYWVGRLPNTDQRWRPVVNFIINFAPERKRRAPELLATDLLLKIIFGEVLDRPEVDPRVHALVTNYVMESARIMDRLKPAAVPPKIPNRILDGIAERLAVALKTPAPRPRKTKRTNIGLLVLLALVLASSKRKR